MTTLTGRSGNFVRIPENQYKADIAAAEERGRAAASQTAQHAHAASAVQSDPSRSPTPTEEQEAAMAAVKALQKESAAQENAAAENEDPKALSAKFSAYVDEQRNKGRRISLAQASHEFFKN